MDGGTSNGNAPPTSKEKSIGGSGGDGGNKPTSSKSHHRRPRWRKKKPKSIENAEASTSTAVVSAKPSPADAVPPSNDAATTSKSTTAKPRKPRGNRAKSKNPNLSLSTPPEATPSSVEAPTIREPPRPAASILQESADQRISLSTRLSREQHECMVCWANIRRRQRTWNCDQCWAVFHLDCVATWALKSVNSSPESSSVTAPGGGKGWRCPACQFVRSVVPSHYFCFCGKHQDPDVDHFQVPHSCGEICARRLQGRSKQQGSRDSLEEDSWNTSTSKYKCPHRCTLPCHPGPCPPCASMAPKEQSRCYCGKKLFPLRCKDLEEKETAVDRSCHAPCRRKLSCQRHDCKDFCHPGSCQPCSQNVSLSCFCGKESKTKPCAEVAGFMCENKCGYRFPCGKHVCEHVCHPAGVYSHLKCPLDPLEVTVCGCGRTSMNVLSKQHGCPPRSACTDPIWSCDSICGKSVPLACGHTKPCPAKCHQGECTSVLTPQQLECKESAEFPCRCGSMAFPLTCTQMLQRKQADGEDAFRCSKMCQALRSCGRHRCNTKCCRGLVEDHACPLTCKRNLKCGNHQCQEPCHKGPCAPCRVASFEEYHCHCGKTVMMPPIPCGRKLPDCPHPCVRERPCGHATVLLYSGYSHHCHADSKPCPPCVIRVEKPCLCGKSSITVPCNFQQPKCHAVCGKVLPCGNGGHFCSRGCHAGECMLAIGDTACQLVCNRKRRACLHVCTKPCHGSLACPEEPCTMSVTQICRCGHRSLTAKCGAYASSEESCSSDLVRSLVETPLECDESCAGADRKRRLANALGISMGGSLSAHSLTSRSSRGQPAFSTELLRYTLANLKWARTIEEDITSFCGNPERQTLRFPPMRASHRQFIQTLVRENYVGLLTEQVDHEPYRSVVVRKRPDCGVVLPREKVTDYARTHGATDVMVADSVGSNPSVSVAKMSACALHHHHLLSSVPGALRDLLAEQPAPSVAPTTKDRVVFPSVDALYLGPIPTGVSEADLLGILSPLLTDLVLTVMEEARFLSKYPCLCECEGCVYFSAGPKTLPYPWKMNFHPNLPPSEPEPVRIQEEETESMLEQLREMQPWLEWVTEDTALVRLKVGGDPTVASTSTLSSQASTSFAASLRRRIRRVPVEISNWILWSACALMRSPEVQHQLLFAAGTLSDEQLARKLQAAGMQEEEVDEEDATEEKKMECYPASVVDGKLKVQSLEQEVVLMDSTFLRRKKKKTSGSGVRRMAVPLPGPSLRSQNMFDSLDALEEQRKEGSDAWDE